MAESPKKPSEPNHSGSMQGSRNGRQRRRHPAKAESQAQPASSHSGGKSAGAGRSKRRRSNANRKNRAAKPSELVRSATTEPAGATTVDAPLTPAEVAELKRHFRFLRDFKKQLKLKLNAQEDLLVNGAREPDHRGVAQHLLAKVEYARVAAAAERLTPKERLQLVEGVLQFTSELSFLLLYLECLKDSEHAGAPAALAQALRRIDFTSVSEGQMRRVLDLMVELFDSAQLPKLMLGLLASRSFRDAFDASLDKLPDGLAQLVLPLRAVHAVVLRGRKNPADSNALTQGVQLLLRGGLKGLELNKPAMRQRLLELALERTDPADPANTDTIRELVDSFSEQPDAQFEWRKRWASRLLSLGRDKPAGKLLTRLAQQRPDDRDVARRLRALRAPRIARFALLRPKGPSKALLPYKTEHPLKPAFCLTTEREVWLRVGEASAAEDFEARCRRLSQLLIPGIVLPMQLSVDSSGRPYAVYPRVGRNAARSFGHDRAALAAELLQLAASLARRDRLLPDLSLARFEVDEAGRLWLLELWDAGEMPAAQAEQHALPMTKQAVLQLLENPSKQQDIERATNLEALLDVVQSERWSALRSAAKTAEQESPT